MTDSEGARAPRRRLLSAFFIAYLALVGFGVFGPAPGEPIRHVGNGVRRVADEVRPPAPAPTTAGVKPPARPEVLFGGLTDENTANVAMFIPFGILFPLVLPRWRWSTVAAGVALSATIELIQLQFLSWRSGSLTDVKWNTVGALIGFGFWLAASAYSRWRPTRAVVEAGG